MEIEYLKKVKERLQFCCQHSGVPLVRIHEACKDELSYPSLRNLINGDALPTNLSHVKTICDAIGADVREILDPGVTVIPDGDSSTHKQMPPISVSCEETEADGIEEIYHCFMGSRDMTSSEIRHGKLHLVLEKEKPSNGPGDSANRHGIKYAWFELDIPASGKNEEPTLLIFKGYPLACKRVSATALLLQSEDSDFMFLCYILGSCNEGKGILVMPEAGSGAPLAQNILLFEEVPDSDYLETCLQGSLKLIHQYAYLPANKVNTLANRDPEMADFLEEYGFLLRDAGDMVQLKPSLLLSALDERDVEGRKRAQKAILKLQGCSINEDKIVYRVM